MIEFYKNVIIIDGKKINFFTEIDEIIDLNQKIIVKVYSTSDYVDYQVKDNIFAINRQGEILWQVETLYISKLQQRIPQIFLGIRYDNNKLLGNNGGTISEIDVETGHILFNYENQGRDKA